MPLKMVLLERIGCESVLKIFALGVGFLMRGRGLAALALMVVCTWSIASSPALAEDTGWVPRPETYASEEEAHADFLAHYQIGDDVDELIGRMWPVTHDPIHVENFDMFFRPFGRWMDIDRFYFLVDKPYNNYEKWRYVFFHVNGELVDWEVQRWFFGENLNQLDNNFDVDDFEPTMEGWEVAQQYFLSQMNK